MALMRRRGKRNCDIFNKERKPNSFALRYFTDSNHGKRLDAISESTMTSLKDTFTILLPATCPSSCRERVFFFHDFKHIQAFLKTNIKCKRNEPAYEMLWSFLAVMPKYSEHISQNFCPKKLLSDPSGQARFSATEILSRQRVSDYAAATALGPRMKEIVVASLWILSQICVRQEFVIGRWQIP